MATNTALSRELEDLRRGKIRFNRAVLTLSPQEAREWAERTVRAAERNEAEEHSGAQEDGSHL